jgi:Amt family ammonium transporter
VHLTCGIWGTLAVGIFSTNPEHSFLIQLLGVVSYGIFTALCALLLFGILRVTMGIRVEPEEELEGLDLSEHGMHSYDVAGVGSGIEDAIAARTPTSLATGQLAAESR